ncbi:RlpA-like double-psi beta-barrel-protein domain-containing protein-containing protein [Suillus bovinus]|uniref:RlpA-like double-psi beta-barrel-protein domain-containing protein-containing protein n=1 Tax=Suillus bovinus TaxID=48563 RepID=UPI001B879A18|nr:RlpA-like double-psi beta-barrel-protein domain-containing protein-containing protein [Suillus bovinus]KAG2158442.1 RlpA-like double-psi beta-barrel-protein domain-containing protein-containing protein [Suillus bovinus]
MRFFAQLSVLLLWCLVPASSAHQVNRRHHNGKRLDSDLAVREPGHVDMYKRDFTNARFTFYDVGLGACGTTNQPGDMVVAMNTMQFPGSCYQTITITCNGKTTQAQVVDECMGCPFGGLDFSDGLFQFFGSLALGVLEGSWSFGSAPAPAPAPAPSTSIWQPPPAPTTTSLPPPPPTTTSTPPPPPSTTPTQSPTLSLTSKSSSSSSSSASTPISSLLPSAPSSVSSTTSADAVAETAGSVGDLSGLMSLNLAMVYLGEFVGNAQT